MYRRDYSVPRLELTRSELQLLRSLVDGPQLGPALASAAARLRSAKREDTIFRWCHGWIVDGLFSSAELS